MLTSRAFAQQCLQSVMGKVEIVFYFISFNAFHITATVFIQQSLYLDDDSAACCFFFNASVQQKAVCQG